MPISVSTFGSIRAVGDIQAGSIFILPTSNRTAIGMMISPGPGDRRYIAWLDEPLNDDEKQLGLSDMGHYARSRALVIDDAFLVLSEEPRYILAWDNQRESGIVVRTAEANIMMFVQEHPNISPFVDLATGLFVPRPNTDKSLALAWMSWVLVRRYNEGDRVVTVPLCKWEVVP